MDEPYFGNDVTQTLTVYSREGRCDTVSVVGAWDDKHPAACSKPAGHDEETDPHTGQDVDHERVRAATESGDYCSCGYPELGPREPDDKECGSGQCDISP